MTGANIHRLRRATGSSSSEKVFDSGDAWLLDAQRLEDMARILSTTAKKVKKGFSDGGQGATDGTAETGSAVFLQVSKDVAARGEQMRSASEVLETAGRALKAAEALELPDEPTPLPERPSSYGTVDEIEAIRADRAFDRMVTRHNAEVSAYGDADEKARKRLEALDVAYAEASAVLAKIHGEPVYPEDLPPPGETGPGGFPGGPVGGPPPGGGLPAPGPGPTVAIPGPTPGEGPGHVPGTGPLGPPLGPGPVGGTIGNPGPSGPGPGGAGPGINPIVAGAAAAGVFGGPGVIKAVRGALAGRGAFGSSPGTIGSSTRAGGASTLGRSAGGGTTGSPVTRGGGRGAGGAIGAGGRGAGGRGAGGRGAGGGRAGAPGTAGGRGSGGRGAAGAATGGRGRKDREDEARQNELFDDGSDWIDDEGAGPEVLG